MLVAFVSQKGGVGKSTLARALAYEATNKKIRTLLADCDPQQATSYHWMLARKKSKVSVQIFATAQQALKEVNNYELVIIDGPARTSKDTLLIAQRADLVIQPTGPSLDDLEPAIKEFNALKQAGIKTTKLILVLNHLTSLAEAMAARQYIQQAGYQVLATGLFTKTSYRQAQDEGKSITEIIYPSLKEQAKTLIEEIVNKVHE